MTSPVFTPLQMFYSTSGLPLTDGYIYIGTASQNPQTNPIAVYWDAAGTIPAAQPIRTSGGYPVRNGSPATVFVLATDFSLIVRDKSSKLVFSRLSGNAFSAEWVTYTPAGTGAVATTVQAKLRESVSVKDFGAVGDGVADDTAAIQAAIDSSSSVFFPSGNYKITYTLTLNVGNHLFGEAYQASRITVTGAITGLSAIFATQTETGIVIENLRIIGDSALSIDLLSFEKATAVSIRDCNIRQTSKSCIRMDDNCINYLIERVRFENFVEYGIHASQFSSVVVVNACQWDANAVNGIACIGLEGVESWTIIGANVNGNNFLGFIRALDGVGGNGAVRTTCIGCYAEGLSIPAFSTQGAAVYDTLQVFGGLFSSNDSVQCADLSNGAAHRRIHLADIRLPSPGYAFNPGSTVEFEFLRPNIDGGGAGVVGYTTTGDVSKMPLADPKIKQYTGSTSGLAPGGTETVTINISADFGATNYDVTASILVYGGGENAQSPLQMSYRVSVASATSISFVCTRDAAGASFQTCRYQVTVFGIST